MVAVLLQVLTWGLRVVAVPSFFCFQDYIMIADSLVSAPGTSEETFFYASYNFIFPVPKRSMWKLNSSF